MSTTVQTASPGDILRYARPDRWATDLKLKVDGRPFNLEGREYVAQVMRDMSPEIVVVKAAQTSFTITFLVTAFHRVVERKWHHLYLLPLKTGAVPFVQSRIDPIINSNEVLRDLFKSVDNRLHKQTREDIKLLIRGTNISTELQEVPVDCEVWDERDRMVEENLEDARHRMDGSKVKMLTKLSTPTEPGHGVDSDDEWHASDQHKWEVPCPHCSRFQVLDWEDSLRIGDTKFDCTIECLHCHKEISDLDRMSLNAKGRWVPHNLGGSLRGYHITQLNSANLTLAEIMDGYFRGLEDSKVMKSHYNQSRGAPYAAAGDQISVQMLDKCRMPGYTLGGIPNSALYVGIDVGANLHVTTFHLGRYNELMLWKTEIIPNPDDTGWTTVEKYFNSLGSFVAVIDAHPEKSRAAALSKKYQGKVWLGFEKDRPDTEQMAQFHPVKYGDPARVVIDRTMAFDTYIDKVAHGTLILPTHARELGENLPKRDYNGYYFHHIQQVRVEEEDTKGRMVARWKKNKNPDHWHHSGMFAMIATLKKPALVVPSKVHNAMKKAGSVARA